MDYRKEYELWCRDAYFDEETKRELWGLRDDEKEIEDRFCRNLKFGTGGLRGVLGAGTNRMNIYTVRKATQGLADYMISQGGEKRGVVIAYDSRHMSEEFSEEAALCLNANKIPTYRFSSLRPTPELSYAVRRLNCMAGIVITASHNPPEYNGYKVYWADGAQITAPRDMEIIRCVNGVKDFHQVRTMTRREAENRGLYRILGEETDRDYIREICSLALHPEVIAEMARELKIVYTPLHGTGRIPVVQALEQLGFREVYVVQDQAMPDGDFPTVPYPNPEAPEVFALALELAKEVDADVILATDPDADRLGVYGKDRKTGEYHRFTGNMTGIFLAEYILSQKKAMGNLPTDGAVIKTIVTTNMLEPLAREYGVRVMEVLTGFKYIGEQIRRFEEGGKGRFLFGFEESYGCLTGTYARDKDAVGAAAMFCEAAAFYKKKGLTVWEQMEKLYEKYGRYQETLKTVVLKRADGIRKMKEEMDHLRANPPKEIEGRRVLRIRDYKAGTVVDVQTGAVSSTGLPASDVLYFELEGDGWQCVRPSGTEPKMKYYYGERQSR